jgi:hypothetical protein
MKNRWIIDSTERIRRAQVLEEYNQAIMLYYDRGMYTGDPERPYIVDEIIADYENALEKLEELLLIN